MLDEVAFELTAGSIPVNWVCWSDFVEIKKIFVNEIWSNLFVCFNAIGQGFLSNVKKQTAVVACISLIKQLQLQHFLLVSLIAILSLFIDCVFLSSEMESHARHHFSYFFSIYILLLTTYFVPKYATNFYTFTMLTIPLYQYSWWSDKDKQS